MSYYFLFVVSRLHGVTQPTPSHNNLCTFRGYGQYPDPQSCSHFYSCSNSQNIRMPCPGGLYFKVTGEGTGYCDYLENVECSGSGDRPTTTPSPTTTPTPTESTRITTPTIPTTTTTKAKGPPTTRKINGRKTTNYN